MDTETTGITKWKGRKPMRMSPESRSVAMSDQQHATGHICTDCLMLHANGEWPEYMDIDELAQYRESIESHPNVNLEMTLGHLHDDPDSQCYHAGEECENDCECEQTAFSIRPCDMCGSTLAGSRDDVTFWWTA